MEAYSIKLGQVLARFMCCLKVLGLEGLDQQTVGAAKPRYALG